MKEEKDKFIEDNKNSIKILKINKSNLKKK
jgi:hypothetical protein